ncbi:MAG: diaminopimelate decarboxylase [Actinomycetota bacterium]|nr:diaminopimelate decarboxylase [Actinomycetota bacterium]
MVLPITARVNEKNHLEIGGCDAIELARRFGTPLFVVDEETIRSQCKRYLKSFRDLSSDTEVIYAGKAFLSLAMCQIIHQENLSLDVSSGGELYLAHRSGFPMERVFFHGNNKTPVELELALDLGVGRIVVDSDNELDLLNRLAEKKGKLVRILLRITPGIVPSTHAHIQTGGVDSKFGFGLADGVALAAVKKALSLKWLELVGFHIHIGSQIFLLHSYARAIEMIMGFIHQTREEVGFVARELNTGGGLGIRYKVTDEPSTVEEYARVIVSGVEGEAKGFGLPVPKIMIEPGRSIVGNAGVTLYTIGTIKEIPGVRTYVSVDGGMSDNLRPMLYGAVYEVMIANKAGDKPVVKVTVAGRHCESGDILIKNARLPHVEIGDILCTPATGAYGYVMANNYNKQPRPAVVLVKGGKVKMIVRRETCDDLLRLEEPLGSEPYGVRPLQ